MSSDIAPRKHRYTRSAANPSAAASSQNPQNPHHLNAQVHAKFEQADGTGGTAVLATQPATPPRTPRRNNLPGHHQQPNSNAVENGSKQKSRNKNRPRNLLASPAAGRQDRQSPPISGPISAGIVPTRPVHTPSHAAYAGPTFHASPAPSALPIPSFYSKSVPDSPGIRGLKGLNSVPSPHQGLYSPSKEASSREPEREESHLDILFNADRAEKERARSAISYQAAGGPFQPPLASPGVGQTPPARAQTHAESHRSKRMSGGGMFAMEELDGEEDLETPFGPPFSTTYSERINAAKSATHQSSHLSTATSRAAPTPNGQNSDALKAYLFSDPSPLSPSPFPSAASSPYQAQPNFHNDSKPATFAQRSQHSDHYFSHDTRPNSAKPPVRSSGLRQEVISNYTPTYASDRTNNSAELNGPPRNYRGASSGLSDYELIFGAMKPSPSSATTPPSTENRGDLQGATEALKKLLKLDALGDAESSQIENGDVPDAKKSIPHYAPPMNGLHNGVLGS